jgi:SOS-response transcriptional repressor LexA
MSFDYNQQKKKIIDFYKSTRRVPSYSEALELLKLSSKNSIFRIYNKLIGEGILTKDSKGKISFTKSYEGVPLLGVVEAGFPTYTEEYQLDKVDLEEMLVDDSQNSYMLEVKGDSMIEAHIEDGDMVIAKKSSTPKVGDIVIAEVDGGWTMKYYRIDRRGKPFLEPANKKYKPIYPEYDLHIAAVVTAVIRKYAK